MIIKPGDRRNLFDQMLAAAMKGQPPVTDIGMNDAVIDALIRVAGLRTQENVAWTNPLNSRRSAPGIISLVRVDLIPLTQLVRTFCPKIKRLKTPRRMR